MRKKKCSPKISSFCFRGAYVRLIHKRMPKSFCIEDVCPPQKLAGLIILNEKAAARFRERVLEAIHSHAQAKVDFNTYKLRQNEKQNTDFKYLISVMVCSTFNNGTRHDRFQMELKDPSGTVLFRFDARGEIDVFYCPAMISTYISLFKVTQAIESIESPKQSTARFIFEEIGGMAPSQKIHSVTYVDV